MSSRDYISLRERVLSPISADGGTFYDISQRHLDMVISPPLRGHREPPVDMEGAAKALCRHNAITRSPTVGLETNSIVRLDNLFNNYDSLVGGVV